MFKFLSPFIRTASLQSTSRSLFRGAQRFLLVLLHDFPEFLSEYYFTICDAIPPRCIQLRNVILSAFPPKITLPDPHVVDIHTEFGPIPNILSDYTPIIGEDLRGAIDRYLTSRTPANLAMMLKERILLPSSTPAVAPERYNLSLINAVTLYIGATSVAQAKARTGSSLLAYSEAGPQLFLQLASELDIEGSQFFFFQVCDLP